MPSRYSTSWHKAVPDLVGGAVTERLSAEMRHLRGLIPEPEAWTIQTTTNETAH